MTAAQIKTYHVRSNTLVRWGGDPTPVVFKPPTGKRFAGDPGTGNTWVGATQGTYSMDWFDKRIYGATPTAKHGVVRIYNDLELTMEPGKKTLLQAAISAGRVPVWSFKQGTVAGATGAKYTCAQIAAGNANTKLDGLFADLYSLGGEVLVTFFHEPEDDHLPLGTKDTDPKSPTYGQELSKVGDYPSDYRAAFRFIVARAKAWRSTGGKALTNVTWVGPMLQGFQFQASAKWGTLANKAWRQYHPNWSGSAWLTTCIDAEGLDIYNPKVSAPADNTARNKSWANSAFTAAVNAFQAETNMPQLPLVIGELGVRGEAFMDDGDAKGNNKVTMDSIMADMVTVGAGQQGLIACCIWNENSFSWDDANDSTGLKVNALKTASKLSGLVTVAV